jgi:hypothetical protein
MQRGRTGLRRLGRTCGITAVGRSRERSERRSATAGTATHCVHERAERAIAHNVRVYAMSERSEDMGEGFCKKP